VKICELCREEVDSEDPDVVEAVELVEALAFGPKRELLEGKHVLFHRWHYPAETGRYRVAA
jgi:hypothetical protein